MSRKPYPTDVSDEEWTFVAPYLTFMTEETPQREHSLREVFNGLRSLTPFPTEGNPPLGLCATWCDREKLGDWCPMTYRRGTRSIYKRNVGSKLESLKP